MKLELRLLGGFAVEIGARAIAPGAWEHKKAAELVKLLALAPGHVLVRDQVLDALWPHLDADAAAAALHKAASHARKALGASTTVVVKGGEVALAPDATVATDLESFEAAAKRALASGEPSACTRAAALYAGELLPQDRYAEWTEARREKARALHLELLRKAGAWKDVVALDPLDEAAHIALARTYAMAGLRAAALRQLRTMRTVLAEQLGVTPSPAAIALFDELSRGPAVHAPIFAGAAMIGRDVELARAIAALRKTAEGRGHTVFVRGEPGIGKTRFCEAILEEASRTDATTLRGAASTSGAASYAPIVEAIDRLLATRTDLAAALAPPDREVIARLAGSASERTALTRQRIVSAVGRLLKLAAKERPVVLFVDDLHEADASTIDVVHYLGELARCERIFVVVAVRPAPGSPVERVRTLLVSQRAATAVELSPLSRAESAELAKRFAPIAPDARVLEAIHARAAGNPLFVELLATRTSTKGIEDAPEELVAVVDALVERVDPGVRALCERIAVLGDTFSIDEVLALGGEEQPEVFRRVDDALRARLVDEAPNGYRFHHALLREGFMRRLPPHRAKQAHAAAAQVLAKIGAPAARIAKQLVHAGADADAVPWLVQAMHEASSVAAWSTALEFAEQALARVDDDAVRAGIVAERAQLLATIGDPSAIGAYEDAIARAPEHRRTGLQVQKAYAQLASGDVGAAGATLAALEPAVDPIDRARQHVIQGQIDFFSGNVDAAEKAAEAARGLAIATGSGKDVVAAVALRAALAHVRGSFVDQVERDLFASANVSAPELVAAIHDGYLCVTQMYLYGGKPYGEVADIARNLQQVAERTGARRGYAFATELLGEAELLGGDLARAESCLAHAEDVARSVDARGIMGLALQRRAEAAIARGDRALARALLEDATAWAQKSELCVRHLVQRIYGARILAANDRDQALAIVDETESHVSGPEETCTACTPTFSVPAALACARAGDLERAGRYLFMSEQIVESILRSDAWRAALDEVRAAIAMHSNPNEARALFAKAADCFARVGQARDADRCRKLANPS